MADCSLCLSGFYLHPTTSECVLACPDGYHEDAASRTCSQCSTGCLTCTGSGTSSCPTCSSQYFAPTLNQCSPCDPLCNECSGTENTNCDACATNKYSVESTSLTCVSTCTDFGANYYLDDPVCRQCDPLCATCTGAGNSLCSSCASGKYSVEGTSTTCVSACSDYASNYFLDGSVCKPCHLECATCNGPEDYTCDTCVNKEILDSSLKSPKHCTSSCGAGLYADGLDCKGKSN